MKYTREQWLEWCRAAIVLYDSEKHIRQTRCDDMKEFDPELARREQIGIDAVASTCEYLRSRLNNGNN